MHLALQPNDHAPVACDVCLRSFKQENRSAQTKTTPLDSFQLLHFPFLRTYTHIEERWSNSIV